MATVMREFDGSYRSESRDSRLGDNSPFHGRETDPRHLVQSCDRRRSSDFVAHAHSHGFVLAICAVAFCCVSSAAACVGRVASRAGASVGLCRVLMKATSAATSGGLKFLP